MDVDKIRTGNIPFAAESVLWFEFLLDPTLLERHLNSPKPDPAPFDLITKFLGFDQRAEVLFVETDKADREILPNSYKSLALKILTMKVMAHLKWNLNILEPKLPSKVVMQVLTDLLCIATEEDIRIDPYPMINYKSGMDHQTIFALQIYHRWILKALMYNSFSWKHPRIVIPTQSGQDPNAIASKKREDFRMMLETQALDSVSNLSRILEEVESLTVPTFQSFIQPTEASQQVSAKWHNGIVVASHDWKCQIHFELGQFLMFRRDHDAAGFHLSACQSLLEQVEKDLTKATFCQVDRDVLIGLMVGCDAPFHSKPESSSLLDQFRESKSKNYQSIIPVLLRDNLLREIPRSERDLVEVEVQQAICCGAFTVAKDLLFKIQVLNAIRRVVDKEFPALDVLQVLRNGNDRGVEFFLSSIYSVVIGVPPDTGDHLKSFTFDLALDDLASCGSDRPCLTLQMLANKDTWRHFFQEELIFLHDKCKCEDTLRQSVAMGDFSSDVIQRNPRLELLHLRNKLSEAQDSSAVFTLLQTLHDKDSTKTWHRSNTRWDVPIPLQSAIMSLQKGFLQDYVYIHLAKSRQLSLRKEFRRAVGLLENAAKQVNDAQGISSGALFKLTRLIEWEILLVQINLYLETFPNESVDPGWLTSACKSCLTASSAGESVIPRLEILESCAIALLNLAEWQFLIEMDKRLIYLELAAALATACHDISKYKGTKKLSREAWDIVLPVFGPVAQKRNVSGTGSTLTKNSLMRFLLQIREATVMTVATSLLAKLHNVLRDEPNLEINCAYAGLWPAMVSNVNSYNAKQVAEVLSQVAAQALTFMPNNFSILKLMGDLSYVIPDWASALKFYLEGAAVASDLFTQPIPRAALDDFTIKRMIKCCSQLNCYTQAAVLCQCLDDVDYSTAFRCLAETKNLQCSDAMDTYYPCIWDLTLLEYLVNMHSKRGETQRKQQVVKIMGLLELNSNNNEEIQREATNIRRNRLLKALIRQYSVSSGSPASFSSRKQS